MIWSRKYYFPKIQEVPYQAGQTNDLSGPVSHSPTVVPANALERAYEDSISGVNYPIITSPEPAIIGLKMPKDFPNCSA